MDRSVYKRNDSETSRGQWQMLVMKSGSDMQGKSFWESLRISVVNLSGQAEKAVLQSHVWLSLLFCTFPINKSWLLFVYTWFSKASESNLMRSLKKNLLFLNKTFSSKTKVFSHFFLPGGILFWLIKVVFSPDERLDHYLIVKLFI